MPHSPSTGDFATGGLVIRLLNRKSFMQLSLKHRLATAGRAVADVVPFQVNKYIRMGLSLFVTLLGFAISVDWSQFFSPEKAGFIIGILGIIKFGYNSFAPGWGVSTIGTGTIIVTQKATTE